MRIPGLLFLSMAGAMAAPDGALLFKQNCSACHHPEQGLVGPSLAEIRRLYLDKPDDFVKWAISPQKKRPTAIEMPAMGHIGEDGLRAIHQHIMETAKGLVAKKAGDADAYAMSPARSALPQVQRIFMPDASPAAIAVALDAKTSFCWDAGSCRLRYVWTGGFIDGFPYWRGNGAGVARLIGKVRYVEKTPIFGSEEPLKFLGYELRDDRPLFRYRIGGTEITESFGVLEGKEGFTRSFTISPAPRGSLAVTLALDQPALITSDKGTITGTKLTLNAAEAAAFTLTYSLK